jgi:hypothetical protein
MTSSKFQVPSSKEAPNFKIQTNAGFWILELEISLELGTWNLEFSQ